MEEQEVNVSITEPLENGPVDPSAFVRDERGQISVFVVLCIIPFIFFVAFIFNTAQQTTRKIEMQGAADAAAVAGAVTMARGMNFMVLNNNSMAEVLSLMIAVRSIRNTTKIMVIYVGAKAIVTCAAAAACLLLCVPITEECAELLAAEVTWISEANRWSSIDGIINDSGGIGWRILSLLDGLNQIIKMTFPAWAVIQVSEYARKNGANLGPAYGLMLPGKTAAGVNFAGLSAPLPIPTFPVARGPEQAIAFQVEACQYKFIGKLNAIVQLYITSIDYKHAAESFGVYQALRWGNINNLKDDWGFIGNIFKFILGKLPGAIVNSIGKLTSALGQFLGIELLGWPSNPPKPMLLTDAPKFDPGSKTDDREVNDDTRNNLRPYLQYLGIALRDVPKGSPIGGERFLNKPHSFPGPFAQMQFTYAQADVYNPTKWDMWTQDWRAQLTRSKLFDEKLNSLLRFLPLENGLDWSFVNNH